MPPWELPSWCHVTGPVATADWSTSISRVNRANERSLPESRMGRQKVLPLFFEAGLASLICKLLAALWTKACRAWLVVRGKREADTVKRSRGCICFQGLPVTEVHKLGGFAWQRCIFSQCWAQQSESKLLAGPSILKALGEPGLSSGFWWLSAILGISWLIDKLQCFYLCRCVVVFPACLHPPAPCLSFCASYKATNLIKGQCDLILV